jgi:uncharacterized membrane protein YhaH (DUF805 family)
LQSGFQWFCSPQLLQDAWWEETFLTIQQGPQMLGFSLAHDRGAVLLLTPFLLALWLLVALATMVACRWRKRSLSRWYWLTLASAIVTLGVLSIPPAFWQWAFIGTFAEGPHAGDLMVYGAAEGDVRTVRGYLEHGVPLTSTNYEGSTAAFAAAVGGSLPMIEMLVLKGADINATNSYGDSPLEATTENGHTDVAAFLKAHGGSQTRGTPEQREAASAAIVRREIERNIAR